METKGRMLWYRWEVSPIAPCVLRTSFTACGAVYKVGEPLGSRDLLEEMSHWGADHEF